MAKNQGIFAREQHSSLEVDSQLDKHLKPVRLKGENTSIEISSEGNGLKVSGDFTATGYIDGIKLRPEASIEADESVYLNSGGAIILNSAGLISLDSTNGRFVASRNGVEFSAANSAYAGMILGYTSLLNDAADASYSVTTSFATVHASTNITFVAPPSGNVEIFASVFCKWTTNRWLQFGLSDNVTYNTLDVTHEHFIGEGDETDEMQINHRWVITGLTAGTSYTYYLGAKAEQASRVTLYWGGDATGEYAPLIMKATALPATIYDGT